MYYRIVLTLCLLAGFLAGCSATQTPFARVAGDVGGETAAAALTIRYVQTGRLTVPYAESSFDAYRSATKGVEQSLPKEGGAPSQQEVQCLLQLYKPAQQALRSPCLESGCDWQAQVSALERASRAFVEASGQ